MQVLPDFATEQTQAGGNAGNRPGHGVVQGLEGFQGLLANFIEEGREVYCGRPPGFAAQEENSGTLTNMRAELFKNALRKRNVSEESLIGLEQYMQSGSPLTIGNAFGVLSGRGGRISEGLSDKERGSFKMLLNKMGLSKDDVEDLVALSDEGDGKNLLRGLKEKLGGLEGRLDVTKEEFSSLLRGLDLSEGTMQKMLHLFGEEDSLSLSGQELEALLADASNEFAKRDSALLETKKHMRAAMSEAISASRAQEQAAPVEDARGNRRSEQQEAFMHDSVLRRTGADSIKQDSDWNEEGFGRDHGGKNGAWGNTGAEAGQRAASKSAGKEKSVESAADKLLDKFELAAGVSLSQPQAAQARNLDIVSERYGREIFSQVEQGILQNARNGSQRITLQLMPEELGKLNIVLTMHQGELKASIIAENRDSAALLSQQMAELKATLEEQGIKVAELEVQTELKDNHFGEQWNDHREHNEMSDAQERDRNMRLSRIRREQAGQEEPAASIQQARQIIDNGLHIVA